MRLQCPNCDAEYQVDDAAIPFEGRDVQCSNCGHGWFQVHPDFQADADTESALYDPPPPLPQSAPSEGVFPKREIDPAALQILREEAAREEAMRATEQTKPQLRRTVATAPTAAQPAMGDAARAMPGKAPQEKYDFSDIEAALDAARDEAMATGPRSPRSAPPATSMPPRAAARRVARSQIQDPTETVPSPAAPMTPAQSGEIDLSTIPVEYRDNFKPSVIEQRQFDDKPYNGQRGRRAGFYSAVLLAIGAVALYVFAPRLAAAVPALAPYLQGYVAAINNLRDMVQAGMPVIVNLITDTKDTVMGLLFAPSGA